MAVERISDKINNLISSQYRKYYPKDKWDKLIGEITAFVWAAMELSMKLSKQAAEIEVIDKSWYEEHGRSFLNNDPRMTNTSELEAGRIDLILCPGFVKRGNDEGTDFEKEAVWIPADVNLDEIIPPAPQNQPAKPTQRTPNSIQKSPECIAQKVLAAPPQNMLANTEDDEENYDMVNETSTAGYAEQRGFM